MLWLLVLPRSTGWFLWLTPSLICTFLLPVGITHGLDLWQPHAMLGVSPALLPRIIPTVDSHKSPTSCIQTVGRQRLHGKEKSEVPGSRRAPSLWCHSTIHWHITTAVSGRCTSHLCFEEWDCVITTALTVVRYLLTFLAPRNTSCRCPGWMGMTRQVLQPRPCCPGRRILQWAREPLLPFCRGRPLWQLEGLWIIHLSSCHQC